MKARTAETGSWLGRRYQGLGIGREMRQAALHPIFAGLDADRATTHAWHDNTASLRVTRSLHYTETGTRRLQRRDRTDSMIAFSTTPEQWATVRRNDIHLVGVAAVRTQLETARPKDKA